MLDFLHSGYYCDLTLSRDDEQLRHSIHTIRETLREYREWFAANVTNPTARLTTTMNQSLTALNEAKRVMQSDNYSELTDLGSGLVSTKNEADLVDLG